MASTLAVEDRPVGRHLPALLFCSGAFLYSAVCFLERKQRPVFRVEEGMFGWLLHLIPRRKNNDEEFLGTPYLTAFHEELDEISDRLRRPLGDVIEASLEENGKCAIFRLRPGTEIIARVRVEGECSTPTDAVVETNLEKQFWEIFSQELPIKVRFEPLAA